LPKPIQAPVRAQERQCYIYAISRSRGYGTRGLDRSSESSFAAGLGSSRE
jgi:hypothetical protein